MKMMMGTRVAAIGICAAAAFVAGCGGGNSTVASRGVLPVTGSPSSNSGSKNGTLTLRITIPQKTTTSGRREPKYISASTTQLAYSIDGTPQTPVALTTANPDCTGSPLTCSVALNVAPATYTFVFTLEDANEHALSQATNVSQTVAAGSANTLTVTLGGIANYIVVTPQSDANRVLGSVAGGFQIYGNAAVQFAVTLQDADHNTIVGTGAPAPSIAPSASAPYTISTPTSGSNVWTLTSTYAPTAAGTFAATSFAVTATPYPNSGGSTITTGQISVQLYQPWIFVINNGKVSTYDEQGNTKGVSISSGLSTPLGITADANPTSSPVATYAGDLFVTNAGGPSVTVYLPSGTATAAPTSFPNLASPGPIVYDSGNNQFYIANMSGATMHAFSEQGAAATFSPAPTVAGPTGLAYDPTDSLIFLSTTAGVNAYGESGAVGSTWTDAGANGIAYDTNNHWLYVTNKTNSTVNAYNSSGTAQSPSGFASLSTPGPILFDQYSNVIYVGDKTTIRAYSESGSAVTLSGSFAVPTPGPPGAMVLVP
jgi:hypothetical protein